MTSGFLAYQEALPFGGAFEYKCHRKATGMTRGDATGEFTGEDQSVAPAVV